MLMSKVTITVTHPESGVSAYAERYFDWMMRPFSEAEYSVIRWAGLYGCVMDAYWNLLDAMTEDPDSPITHWTPMAEAMKTLVWSGQTTEIEIIEVGRANDV